jgi:very-short-patch-repair endonuclease
MRLTSAGSQAPRSCETPSNHSLAALGWRGCVKSWTGERSRSPIRSWSALRIVREAGLPPPQTQHEVNGFRVDFYWPEIGLVVETDGLRYHRTPAAQARDRQRDQAHAAAGLTSLRFTHAQVRYEPRHVVRTLRAVFERLNGPGALQ